MTWAFFVEGVQHMGSEVGAGNIKNRCRHTSNFVGGFCSHDVKVQWPCISDANKLSRTHVGMLRGEE